MSAKMPTQETILKSFENVSYGHIRVVAVHPETVKAYEKLLLEEEGEAICGFPSKLVQTYEIPATEGHPVLYVGEFDVLVTEYVPEMTYIPHTDFVYEHQMTFEAWFKVIASSVDDLNAGDCIHMVNNKYDHILCNYYDPVEVKDFCKFLDPETIWMDESGLDQYYLNYLHSELEVFVDSPIWNSINGRLLESHPEIKEWIEELKTE